MMFGVFVTVGFLLLAAALSVATVKNWSFHYDGHDGRFSRLRRRLMTRKK